VKIYGKRPIKLDMITNINIEIREKIVPGSLIGPNTAESSPSKYLIILCTDIIGDEHDNQ